MKRLETKILYLIITLIIVFSCNISYAKSIDLNGVIVSLTAEVTKKTEIIGQNVKEDNRFSTTEYEREEKDRNDRYVQIELSIKNSNPYESANVTIEEFAPTGFRQLDSNKNEKVIKTKIDAKSEKKYKYSYRYHQSFLKDHNNSILYDSDGNIIDRNGSTDIDVKEHNEIVSDKSNMVKNAELNGGNIDDETSDLKSGASRIIIFLIVFVVCIILLLAFLMFYRIIKGNDDFYSNDPFNCLILFLLLSFLINILFTNKSFAKSQYTPQIYEYGKSYEKVIYESIYFKDGLYKFAYKVSFSFDNTYEINDEDYENDTDGDGLIDAFEYMYMTDKNNVDTDGDGLSDYLEVMYLDYNPLSDNTFSDGIKDGDRDFDNDKLTNIEEVRHGTDLSNVDTDFDTLTDYEEIEVHNTNPLSIDTDEDLLSDPDELKLGLNPNNPKTDGITLDSERKIRQSLTMDNVPAELRQGDIFISSVNGNISGNIDNEVKISKKNEEVFNTMSSFVQSGFKVELKEDERIDIELDVSKVSDRKTTLIIVKYEDGTIETIDTICDGNNLKANISSGTYSVMDSEIVLKDLNIMISDYMP